MTTSTVSAASESAKQTCGALLSTLAGLGSTWAAYGLKIGKMALEQSADALGKTAHTLDTLAAELEKKAPHEAAKADVVVDADAPTAAHTADAPTASPAA
jgi:hypothetical protein